ncbi:uncharacterized protein RSE6_04318 [Rhynchosporium secalis]|uniref:Protein prenyltransferase alpha subunit repeat-containing protein 1 n=1 Tax=Rhynchosporium secalis TaxID=38038 RepID=A0A1E1M4Z4_RHYSE|nr:uncharacterized protein RSE6_04318 [Rhynchosporium secalis]
MSRALDPDTAISIQKANSQTIYRDLVSALSTNTIGPLEMEFLPKSYPLAPDCNVLVEGNNIAVTKIKLVQAFIVAQAIFFNYMRECTEAQESELRDVTAVMLLLDPEHLTAANTRKRLIQRREDGPGNRLEELLRQELLFVDGYLTSRLHRHTKSPTLWGHRRWVLGKLKSLDVERDVFQDLKSVILVAAERHPQNYYAWSHMRWLVQVFGESPTRSIQGEKFPLDHSKLVSIVQNWCLKNPSDTSGFSFLLFCLFKSGSLSALARIELCSSVCADILRLAVSFRWIHESVWVFLRTVIASEMATESIRTDFLQAINTIANSRQGKKAVLESAKGWYRENQQILQI